jgi:hypothetical protein
MRQSALADARAAGAEAGECRISESILPSERSPRCVRGAEQGLEGVHRSSAAVVAEDVLVEVGGQVLA